MNKLILGILCVQTIICLLSTLLRTWWLLTKATKHTYIVELEWKTGWISLVSFFSFFLLYNTMIPISLVVSMEFVKVF